VRAKHNIFWLCGVTMTVAKIDERTTYILHFM
jgi:hypothetical protein